MAGMTNLLSVQARAGGTVRTGSAPPGSTASATAYGTSLAPASVGGSPLLPNDAGGAAFWTGIAGVGFLIFMYYSLPG
jgi:hypothetical protein